MERIKPLANLVLAVKQGVQWLKRLIPTHIQSLTWVCVDSNQFYTVPIFETMNPHWCWISQWDDGSANATRETPGATATTDAPITPHPFVTLPSKGYFVWVIWDSKIARRRYICLRMSEIKDIFYDIETVNDLFAWQDRAILKRIHTFTFMDSCVHRKDHKLLDISVATTDPETQSQKTVSILKTLLNHELEESIYIPKNLTGGALLWLYHFVTHTLPSPKQFPVSKITVTDYELEEKEIGFDEFVFA